MQFFGYCINRMTFIRVYMRTAILITTCNATMLGGLCRKEDNPGQKNIKGDNAKKIILCGDGGIVCDLTHGFN